MHGMSWHRWMGLLLRGAVTKDGAVCWKYAGEGNTHTRTNVAEGLPPETGSGVPMS